MSTRLLDEMRDLMRRRHYSIHTERAYRDIHVLQQGGHGVKWPLDDLAIGC